jgi:hypothetical protein
MYDARKMLSLSFEEEFMKSKNLLALLVTLSFAQVAAMAEEQVLNSDPID